MILANNMDQERLKLLDKEEQNRLLEKYKRDEELLNLDLRHSELGKWLKQVCTTKCKKEDFKKEWLSDKWDKDDKK
jgi:hypothetical protein